MARTTTDRLKFNPPLGNLPAPQFLLPEQLQIDESYQRSIDTPASQALIRKIAQHWNWDLCLALVVARRENGDLFVIDGQHRLEAARLRGDIAQLPAMVKNYASPADEAASFVSLNQARAPLTGLQLFHAALASGDSTAIAVRDAIIGAGLKLGRSNNLQLAPIGTVINIGGILRAWKRHGAAAATEALELLAAAFAGQRLLYAGTIYPGLAATCARELRDTGPLSPGRFAMLSAMLGGREQAEWRRLIYQAKAADPGMSIADAAAVAIAQAWTARSAAVKASPPPLARPSAPPPAKPAAPAAPRAQTFDLEGKAWCTQCEQRRQRFQVANCISSFCALKPVA